MIQVTVKDMLRRTSPLQEKGEVIYVIRTDGTVFYVGKASVGVFKRFRQHLQSNNTLRPSSIGATIIVNLPDSLAWTFEAYTLKECFSLEGRKMPRKDLLEMLLSSYIDEAETFMIHHLQPCINLAAVRGRSDFPSSCYKDSSVIEDACVDERGSHRPFRDIVQYIVKHNDDANLNDVLRSTLITWRERSLIAARHIVQRKFEEKNMTDKEVMDAWGAIVDSGILRMKI